MCTRCGNGEMGRWGDGEIWGGGKVGRWGEMGRWGGGEVGRWGDEEIWGDGEMGTSLPVHVSTIKDNLGTICLCGVRY